MRKYLLVITFAIVIFFSVSVFADDFISLGDQALSAYKKGNFQEAINSLSKMIEIAQTKMGELSPTELLNAGNGFYYSNVNFEEDSTKYTRCYGEITNKSGKSYSLAFFNISVYDLNGKLIAVGYVMIPNLQNNDTVTFDSFVEDNGKMQGQFKYKIRFSNGV